MSGARPGPIRAALLSPRQRRRRGVAPSGGRAPLTPWERRLHDQLKGDGRLKSGRAGAYVYYVSGGRQRWHRYVVPRDPHTPAQQELRAVFGAATKAWSANGLLTPAERAACYAAGARRRSRPRLTACGKLSGQQYFVGLICQRALRQRARQWTFPSAREITSQLSRSQLLAQAASELRRTRWLPPAYQVARGAHVPTTPILSAPSSPRGRSRKSSSRRAPSGRARFPSGGKRRDRGRATSSGAG